MDSELETTEYIVDLDGVETEDEVHERLAESLPLPDYYGGNLDALYDVLTEYGDGWHIIIVGVEGVSDEIRPYIDEMLDVFEEASCVLDDMTYEVEDGSSGFYDDED